MRVGSGVCLSESRLSICMTKTDTKQLIKNKSDIVLPETQTWNFGLSALTSSFSISYLSSGKHSSPLLTLSRFVSKLICFALTVNFHHISFTRCLLHFLLFLALHRWCKLVKCAFIRSKGSLHSYPLSLPETRVQTMSFAFPHSKALFSQVLLCRLDFTRWEREKNEKARE